MSGTIGKDPDVLDVAIVGAGIAGTYAAYRLRNANKRVGLFECSNRIGGRLFTYHLPCSPSINIELGGMRFLPQRHKILNSLITELGLSAIPFSEKKSTTLYYLRGQHLSEDDILNGQIPYALNEREKENQHRLWNYYLEKLLGINDERSLLQRVQDPEIKELLQTMSFKTALNLVASPEGKAFVLDNRGLIAHAYVRNKASALMGFRNIAGLQAGEVIMTLKNGMSSLPLQLNKCFEESSKMNRTFLNHRLISIQKTWGKQYSLKFQLTRSEVDDTQSDVQDSIYEVLVKSVILALPVHALGAIQWAPFQEIYFQRTKSLIVNTAICKVFLAFNHPWWKDYDKDYSVTVSDQIYRVSVDFGSHDGTFVLLASYSYLTDIFRVMQSRGKPIRGSAPGDMRVSTAMSDFVLDELSRTLRIPRSKIPEPIGGVSKFWDSSPYGGGVQCWKRGLLNQGAIDRVTDLCKAKISLSLERMYLLK